MNLQYISDSQGKTTGVFIPINEWNMLNSKHKGIENEDTGFPEWHQSIVKERLKEYKKSPGGAIDFNQAMNDIEKEM